MKTSELIKKLQKSLAENGDLVVHYFEPYSARPEELAEVGLERAPGGAPVVIMEASHEETL